EVSLRILFGSDGKLKVLGIVQGLGYGLDENAASAAARIEFRPARRAGRPVEQAAVVRVQFYLAQ
ncbi:MAG: energy transducer TonB, partial [Acidobacteriota bacterium]